MAKLEGKLPFTNAIYADRDDGELVKVVSRERIGDGITWIHYVNQQNQLHTLDANIWYDNFKRCKEGTAFHIEEGWNE